MGDHSSRFKFVHEFNKVIQNVQNNNLLGYCRTLSQSSICFSYSLLHVHVMQIGQAKPMNKIKAWSDHIVKHFWYCSSVCKQTETTSDEEALKIMKVQKVVALLLSVFQLTQLFHVCMSVCLYVQLHVYLVMTFILGLHCTCKGGILKIKNNYYYSGKSCHACLSLDIDQQQYLLPVCLSICLLLCIYYCKL